MFQVTTVCLVCSGFSLISFTVGWLPIRPRAHNHSPLSVLLTCVTPQGTRPSMTAPAYTNTCRWSRAARPYMNSTLTIRRRLTKKRSYLMTSQWSVAIRKRCFYWRWATMRPNTQSVQTSVHCGLPNMMWPIDWLTDQKQRTHFVLIDFLPKQPLCHCQEHFRLVAVVYRFRLATWNVFIWWPNSHLFSFHGHCSFIISTWV